MKKAFALSSIDGRRCSRVSDGAAEVFEHSRLTIADGIATVTLDRQDKLNAINEAMRRGLAAAVARVRNDDSVRAVVLTGAGDRAFCAGADVTEFIGRSLDEQRRLDRDRPRIYEELESLPQPVICAINGLAYGGGCELALACDVRIAAENASIGLLEIRHGLIPGGGGTQRLPRLVGLGRALQMILSGDPVPARRALEIGLVEDVVPAGAALGAASELAARLAQHSPVAVRAAKAAVRAATSMSLSDGLRFETESFLECLVTPEAQTRLDAFRAGGGSGSEARRPRS
jgi:enoyl-CoA hydratase